MQYQLKDYRDTLLNGSLNLFNALVRLDADYRINPHAPPFKQTPANLFSFTFCNVTHQARHLSVYVYTHYQNSVHTMPINSQYKLQGSQILFDTYTQMV